MLFRSEKNKLFLTLKKGNYIKWANIWSKTNCNKVEYTITTKYTLSQHTKSTAIYTEVSWTLVVVYITLTWKYWYIETGEHVDGMYSVL